MTAQELKNLADEAQYKTIKASLEAAAATGKHSISVGSPGIADATTERLKKEGFKITYSGGGGKPHYTHVSFE